MIDFELRLLKRKTGETGMNEWGYYYDKTETILQYRKTVKTIDYSSKDQIQTMKIQEWQDVPTEVEI